MQICVQTLWCCLQPVWTLPFTAVCSIICVRVLQGAPRLVWTGPKWVAGAEKPICTCVVLSTTITAWWLGQAALARLRGRCGLKLNHQNDDIWKQVSENFHAAVVSWLSVSRPMLSVSTHLSLTHLQDKAPVAVDLLQAAVPLWCIQEALLEMAFLCPSLFPYLALP